MQTEVPIGVLDDVANGNEPDAAVEASHAAAEEETMEEAVARARAEIAKRTRAAYAALGIGPEGAGIVIDGVLYESPDDFTIGEAETIKLNAELTPQELLTFANEDQTDPTCLRALAWVVLHRLNEKTEWEDERITRSSVGLFFKTKEEEGKQGDPPADGAQKRS